MNLPFKIVVLLALIAVIVLAASSLLKKEKPQSVPPSYYKVKRMDIEQSVYGSATLRCSRRAEIASRVAGKIRLENVLVKEGDAVKSSQVLCKITNEDLQKELNEAQTKLEIAQFHYDDSEEEYQNKRKHYEQFGESSEKQLNRLKVELRNKELDLQKAKEAVDTLKEKVGYLTVTSPLSGRVLKSHLKPADMDIDPDKEYPEGTPLFVVGDLNSLAVYGTILESDRTKVQRGDAVMVQCGRKEFLAKVTRLSLIPSMSSDGGRYETQLDFENPPSGVNEGRAVNFRIIVEKKSNVLAVPIQYVEVEGERHRVKLVAGKKVTRVPIEVGISSESFYEVTAGLKEGDTIRWDAGEQ